MHVLEADIIAIKKKQQHWFDGLAQKMHFLQDIFQMTVIALVSVINNYHIKG